jgi:hypothetical protein
MIACFRVASAGKEESATVQENDKKGAGRTLSTRFPCPSSLDSLNVLSLPALWAFSDIELHCLAFL